MIISNTTILIILIVIISPLIGYNLWMHFKSKKTIPVKSDNNCDYYKVPVKLDSDSYVVLEINNETYTDAELQRKLNVLKNDLVSNKVDIREIFHDYNINFDNNKVKVYKNLDDIMEEEKI
jgi:hypothetical protein